MQITTCYGALVVTNTVISIDDICRFTGTPAAVCATIIGSLHGVAATTLFIVFGSLALVPGPDFDHRDLSAFATSAVMSTLSSNTVSNQPELLHKECQGLAEWTSLSQ